MPFVRIDTQKARYSSAQREAIGEGVYQALLRVGALEDDRIQVFSEKAEGDLRFGRGYLGIDRSDGFVAIQITMNAGRDVLQKKGLYADITAALSRDASVRREDVFINLVEVPKENWSFGNGQAQYVSLRRTGWWWPQSWQTGLHFSRLRNGNFDCGKWEFI